MARTIFLTGAAGFIGAHTAKALLERGDTVIGIDNLNDYYSPQLKDDRLTWLKPYPEFHFYKADIADQQDLNKIIEKHLPDTICHLAAQAGVQYSLQNPLAYIQSNVVGTTVIFEAAKQFKIPQVVYASSSSVYGNSPTAPFTEEQNTDHPISLYAATKKSCEVIAYSYHHLYGIKTTGLRFFTVYGPWGRPDMAPFKFAKGIWKGETLNLNDHGKARRDFTFIDDIVSGILLSLDKSLDYELINLGGSNVVDLESFVSLFEKHLQKTAKRNLVPLPPGDVPLTSAKTDRAQQLLGWAPKTPIDKGVQQFCRWFKEYYSNAL